MPVLEYVDDRDNVQANDKALLNFGDNCPTHVDVERRCSKAGMGYRPDGGCSLVH